MIFNGRGWMVGPFRFGLFEIGLELSHELLTHGLLNFLIEEAFLDLQILSFTSDELPELYKNQDPTKKLLTSIIRDLFNPGLEVLNLDLVVV